MPARSSFTDEEWDRLRVAPWQVGLGVIAADPSGIGGRIRELAAVEQRVRRTAERPPPSALVAEVATDLVSGATRPHATPGGLSEEELAEATLARCAEVRRLLDERAGPEESRGFRRWLLDVATDVAAAADDGVASGVGGQVSDRESSYLGQLAGALGLGDGDGDG